MLSRAAHFTTMLLSPGIFRPKVRLHFSHLSPSGVGLPQQGHYERIGAHRDGPLYQAVYRQRTSTERANSHAKKQFLLDHPLARNFRSVRHLNTLTCLLINLKALLRAKSINASLLSTIPLRN
jgi:hypothetical protein